MPIEIDGLWCGHYELGDGSRYPITVRFAQTADDLRGEMTDGVNTFEFGPDDWRAQGMQEKAIEQVAADLYARFPSEVGKPFVVTTRLPVASDIVGYIQGAVVQFRKTYRGSQRITWRVGRLTLEQELPGHAVVYVGDLSQNEKIIAGRWHTGLKEDRNEGRFELRRQ